MLTRETYLTNPSHNKMLILEEFAKSLSELPKI